MSDQVLTNPAKECSGDLLSAMVRQLKLKRPQDVVDLVECPLTADSYVAVLKEKGIIHQSGG